MQISTVRCGKCGAIYDRAESSTVPGTAPARDVCCSLCDTPLEQGSTSRLLAYRLIVPPDPPQILPDP
jgi:hypothetical protein